MNFISNVLDAIPIVGHAKGVIHYVVGDKEGGDKAMYQSTRTSAVIAGGVVGGVVGGPAGAVGGAIYGGSLTDIAASGAMGKPQGFVKDCVNVGTDIQHGRNPAVSLLVTGAHVGLDAVGGLGMGGLSSATANSVGKKIASNVGEEIIEKSVKITAEEMAKLTARKVSETVVKNTVEKTAENAMIQALCVTAHITERAALETIEEEQAKKNAEQKKGETKATKKENVKNTDKKNEGEKETGKKTTQSGKNAETGSGSQPPEEKKDNNKKDGCNNPNNFSDFLKLLKEILEIICRKENREKIYKVFETLSPGQRKSVVKLIKKLNYYGATEKVLKLVIQIFGRFFPSDFTFVNFLSLMEFVKTYIVNEIEEKCMVSLGTEATPLTEQFKQLVTDHMNVVTSDFDILRKLLDTFNDIRVKIEAENASKPVDPNFRDIFSAVYHYFKHKIVPGSTLSVNQYYEWIRYLLRKVKRLPEWSHLGDPQNPRNEIVYELYVVAFGKRIRIVVKFQGGRIVLSSCYVVSDDFDDDEDGDVFIDGNRRR